MMHAATEMRARDVKPGDVCTSCIGTAQIAAVRHQLHPFGVFVVLELVGSSLAWRLWADDVVEVRVDGEGA